MVITMLSSRRMNTMRRIMNVITVVVVLVLVLLLLLVVVVAI